jgi:hypothetical protein
MIRFMLAAGLVSAAAFAAEDPRLKTFNDRVQEYAKLRKQAVEKTPALPKKASPEEIEKHEKALVEAIRNTRPHAQRGDVFTAESQPVFVEILKRHLSGPGKQASRETAKQGNPKRDPEPGEKQPTLQVNAVYPKSAALSSVPPGLLMDLPKLPMDIEYRFVGRTLVLWDSRSNLVIDYMKEVAPGI